MILRGGPQSIPDPLLGQPGPPSGVDAGLGEIAGQFYDRSPDTRRWLSPSILKRDRIDRKIHHRGLAPKVASSPVVTRPD
jgi:hypothetical protein